MKMSDWCQQCMEAPATTRFRNYDVCELCCEQGEAHALRSKS